MKRKSAISIVLSVLLFIALTGAKADGLSDNVRYHNMLNTESTIEFKNVLMIDETYYALGSDHVIYAWTRKSDAAYPYCVLPALPQLDSMGSFPNLSQEGRKQFAEGITHLFSGDGSLWGINILAGGIGKITKDGVIWEDAVFDCAEILERYNANAAIDLNGFVDQNVLYFLTEDTIHCWDISNQHQKMIQVQAIITDFIQYKQGHALLVVSSDLDDDQFYAIDFSTTQVVPVPFDSTTFLRDSNTAHISIIGPTYDQENDEIYFQMGNFTLKEDGMICRVTKDGSLEKLFQTQIIGGWRFTQGGKEYIIVKNNGATTEYNMDALKTYQPITLNVKGLFPYSQAKLQQFTVENPGIQVRNQIANLDDNDIAALLTKDNAIDIYAIFSNQLYKTAANKGYALDLGSSSIISRAVSNLYPAIKRTITNEAGAITGYPYMIGFNLWRVNAQLWKDIYGDQAYPVTFNDLFALISDWDRATYDDYQSINPYGPFDMSGLLWEAVYQYIANYEQIDQPITFDTPAFRETLKAFLTMLSTVDQKRFQQNLQEGGGYLFSGGSIMAEYNTYVFQVKADEYEVIEPLRYDSEKQSIIQGEIILLFVNPSSTHRDEAIRFIEFVSQQKNTDPILYYALHSGLAVPYEDPKHAVRVKELGVAKADLEKRLSVAQTAAIKVIGDEIAQIDAQIERQEERRWLITVEGANRYQNWMEHLSFSDESLYISQNDLNNVFYTTTLSLCGRMVGGNLDEDGFIREMDAICKKIYSEK